MPNKKISALTSAATPLAGTETLPIVQSGATTQVSVANLTAGRSVSTGALSVIGATATLDNAYALRGKLVSGTPVGMIQRNSSDQVAIDPDGYGAVIGFGGRYSFAGGGDFTNVIGNYVPGTAAKGINFTANTPAAGMTSQLLNWYEEGAWTPTDSSGAGLTLSVVAAYYTKVGSLVTCTGRVTYPANASAAQTRITPPFSVKGPTAFTVSTNFPSTVTGYANGAAMFFFVDAQGAISNQNAASTEFNISFSYVAA